MSAACTLRRPALLALLPALLVASLAPGARAASSLATPPGANLRALADAGRVSVDWKDAQLTDALRIIARVGGVNLVLDPSVAGRTVTLSLDDVPWQQALELACSVHGLGAEQDGNVVRVAPLAKLIQEQQLIAQHRDARALTAPLSTVAFPLSWTDAASAEAIVRKSLSPRGTTRVDRRTNTLFVTDAFDDPGASELQSAFFAGITIVPDGASRAERPLVASGAERPLVPVSVSVDVRGASDGSAIVALLPESTQDLGDGPMPTTVSVPRGDRTDVPGVPGLSVGIERDGERSMLVLRAGRAGVAVPASGPQAVRARLASGGEILVLLRPAT